MGLEAVRGGVNRIVWDRGWEEGAEEGRWWVLRKDYAPW